MKPKIAAQQINSRRQRCCAKKSWPAKELHGRRATGATNSPIDLLNIGGMKMKSPAIFPKFSPCRYLKCAQIGRQRIIRVIFPITMAMDRNTYRNLTSFETLDARTLFAAVGLQPAPNGPGYDSIQKQIKTSDGSVAVGLFSGTVSFNTSVSTTKKVTAAGDTDVYIAKYDTNGYLTWIQTISGDFTDKAISQYKKRDILTNPKRLAQFLGKVGEQPLRAGEYVYDVAIDASNNIIVTGSFTGSVKIGGHTYTSDDTIGDKYYDGYVAKFAANGSASWVQQLSGPFDDYAGSVAVDGSGNIYVGGYYTRQAKLSTARKATLFTTEGRDAGFVARYSTSGVLSWTYQFTSKTGNRYVRNAVNDIAVTSRGEVYFAGTFGDKVAFDPSNLDNEIKAVGQSDAVVGKLTRKGGLGWFQTTGGKRADGNSAIAIDSSGNVYTAGYFSSKQDVDPRANVTNTLTPASEKASDNPDYSDVLLSKFTSTGTPVWQGQLGGNFIELISGLEVSSAGTVDLSGSFFGTADFAPGANTYNLSSTKVAEGDSIKDRNTTFGRKDSYDWFFVRVSARGKFVDAARFGGADDDYSSGLSESQGVVYVSGRNVSAVGDRDARDEFGQTILPLGI